MLSLTKFYPKSQQHQRKISTAYTTAASIQCIGMFYNVRISVITGMQTDTIGKVIPQKSQLCTHHVGSGRKDEQGILGSVNTARLATWLRGLSCTDLRSDFTAARFILLCSGTDQETDSGTVIKSTRIYTSCSIKTPGSICHHYCKNLSHLVDNLFI